MRRFRSARKRPGAGELPALAPGRTRARIGDGAIGDGAMRLGRAPREVYRVYNEREFLADGAHEERFDVEHGLAGARQLHRLAGVTVLLATVGAVGGLVAFAGVSSLAGARRRGGSRFSADVASRTEAPLPPRRQQPRSHHLDLPTGPARAAKPAGGVVHSESQRRPSDAARWRHGASGPAREEAPASVETAASTSVAPRGATVATRPSGQIEFGFER